MTPRHTAEPRSGLSVGFSAGVVTVALALVLLAPAHASAHVPYIASGRRTDHVGTLAVPYPQAEAIPSPYVSRAVYGYLSPDAAFDVYTFTVPATTTIDIGLIVPVRVGLETFRPTLRVFAENSGVELAGVDSGQTPRSSFWEPFSAASFWTGPDVGARLTPDDRYYVVVYPPAQGRSSGAYVLTFSGPEKFTTSDWLRTGAMLPTIWLGSWAGGPARPGAYVCGVALVVLLVAAVSLWLRRRRRRRRRLAERAIDGRAADAPPADAPPTDSRD